MIRTIVFQVFIFIILSSCTPNSRLKLDESSEIEDLLSSNNVSFEKRDDTYNLNVVGSKLKTNEGKEFASSICVIILYEQIVKENSTLHTNTNFKIIFNDDKVYNYSLLDVSDAINAKTIIEKSLSEIAHQNNISAYTCNEDTGLQDIKWKDQEITIAGFKKLSKTVCGKSANIVEYHIFIQPKNLHLIFEVDYRNNKILEISEFKN